jgi:formylglycine-generating enzyme required for sulfatase activity
MGKFALLIGVGSYRSPDLHDLLAAPRDVEAMQRVLVDPAIGGFAVDDVCVLQNPEPQEMREEIERLFINRKRSDLVLLYFSGHGVMDDAGQFYLTTVATDKGRLRSTAIESTYVHGLMEQRGKDRSQHQVVILDSCFSGAFAEGMAAKGNEVNLQPQLGGKGRAVLTSSSGTEYSFEQKDGELSVYTQYVVEGLRIGTADKNGDGNISVDELHEFVAMKVGAAAPAMQPKIYAVEEGYKIIMAKAPVGDPKLLFRKEVETLAKTRNGVISSVLQRGLKRQFKGQISADEIDIILNEILQPYREFQENLREFQDAIDEFLALPESQKVPADLTYLQYALGLRDEDVHPWMKGINVRPKVVENPVKAEQSNQVWFEFTTAQVDPKGKVTSRSTGKINGISEDLGAGIVVELVKVPDGSFTMGSPKNEEGRDWYQHWSKDLKNVNVEGPQHQVQIPGFFMGRYPVTQAQWKRVAGTEKVAVDLDADPSYFKGANRPVEQVSWDQATEFCARLSRATNRAYRLPSESEWEYACRAGTDTPFSFGSTLSPDVANYDCNYTYGEETKGKYREETSDVGCFPANAFGLYDMHGNVWEWCQDVWQDDYSNAPTDGSAHLGPQGNKLYRLLRGGSWCNCPWYCRSADRNWGIPGSCFSRFGFRLACSLAA